MSAEYMELRAEFQCVVEEMDWRDVLSSAWGVVGDLLNTANPPPPCPSPPLSPPPFVPAGYDGCSPLEAAAMMAFPEMYHGQAAPINEIQNVMQPGHLHSQAGAQSLGQFNNVPVMSLPDCMTQNLTPVGVLNGELVYGIPADLAAPSSSAVPPPHPNISISKKQWIEDHNVRPHVKKPPNAFMLFMKEQRHMFTTGPGTKGAAAVNAILGQKWNELSKEEQAKYFEEAERQRQLHRQQHPDWSTRENYGKKRRRESIKAPIIVKASAAISTEVMQQAKRPRVTPVYSDEMEPSTLLTDVTGPSTSQASFMETPWRHTGAPVTVPVCDMCHLPRVCGFDLTSSPPAVPTVSPAAPTETETAESDHLAWVEDIDALIELLEVVESLPDQPEPQPQDQPQHQHQVQPLPQLPSSPNMDICTLDFSDLL